MAVARSATVDETDVHTILQIAIRAKTEWEQTVDCLPLLIIMTDGSGNIRRANRALADLVGRTLPELIGEEWQTLCRTAGFELGDDWSAGEEIHHGPTDRWFAIGTHDLRVQTEEKETARVIIMSDTTGQKSARESLEQAYALLKASQAQLVQQEKMSSIGQLAAGVAHEINNPMGFITSNLNTLRRYLDRLGEFLQAQERGLRGECTSEDVASLKQRLKIEPIIDDISSLIGESLDGAERVRKIVADLKSFSRVDQAESQLADLNECLETTLNIVWNELKYKATVIREFGTIPLIRCYPQQLNQVFVNLLINAAQAIEHQGEIRLRTGATEGAVVIAISDSGCGIPPEIRNRIFEPFFTTKAVGQGTGLGLSISYDIVKKHGGTMTVESDEAKGTTFTITLPYDPDAH